MPVDELSRGREGMALLIDERSAMSYVELTPWFSREPWRSVVDQGLGLDLAERQVRAPDTPRAGTVGSATVRSGIRSRPLRAAH